MSRHPLAALFGDLEAPDADDRDTGKPHTPPDVFCLTLREVAARYAVPCPFKAGDLVTPRRDANVKGAGAPHIVLELIERPDPDFRHSDPNDTGSNAFGRRRDMRVACAGGSDSIVKFWVESCDFEPYTGPVATLDDTAA